MLHVLLFVVLFMLLVLLVLLVLLMGSGEIRSRARIFLGKHFFRNQYDYREEWLRFTRTLSGASDSDQIRGDIVRAIAAILNAPAGALWVRAATGAYERGAEWNWDRAPRALRAHRLC